MLPGHPAAPPRSLLTPKRPGKPKAWRTLAAYRSRICEPAERRLRGPVTPLPAIGVPWRPRSGRRPQRCHRPLAQQLCPGLSQGPSRLAQRTSPARTSPAAASSSDRRHSPSRGKAGAPSSTFTMLPSSHSQLPVSARRSEGESRLVVGYLILLRRRLPPLDGPTTRRFASFFM